LYLSYEHDDDDDDDCSLINGVIVDDDEDDHGLSLANVSFVRGVGFVRDICDGVIALGIGQFNVLYPGETISVRILVRPTPAVSASLTVTIGVEYRGSGGLRTLSHIVVSR
jgi:hypothetical protein